MAILRATLNLNQIPLRHPFYWLSLVLVVTLLGLASAYAPALTLALILISMILWVFLQSWLKRDYFNIFAWVCLGYLGFAFGGLYYATSSGPIYEYGYYINRDGQIHDLGLLVYASLPENQPYLILALFIAIVGLLSFGMGYAVLPRRQVKPGTRLVERRHSRRRLFVVVGLMTIAAFIFIYLYFESSGGFLYLITHIYGRTIFRSSAYLNWGVLLLPVANLLWFSYDYLKTRKNLLFWIHLIFTSLVLISLGDRWGILGFWLMLTMIHYYLSGRKIKIQHLIILGALVIIVSMAVGIWRNWATAGSAAATGNLQNIDKAAFDMFQTVLAGRNLTDIDVLTWIIGRGSKEIGWLAGKTFLQVIYAPIPRSLFPAKPDDLGQIVFWNYTDTDIFNSWHPSLIGELYLNFMFPGVVFGMFCFGWVSSWIEHYRRRSLQPDIILLYAIFTAKFVILLVTVDFLMSFLQAIFYIIPVVIARLYINRINFRLRKSQLQISHTRKANNPA